MKLVELTRQTEDATAEVMGAVGPLADADADAYAAHLEQLIDQRGCGWLSVRTTPVTSISGATADPPADPGTLLTAVLERGIGEEGEHDLPESPTAG